MTKTYILASASLHYCITLNVIYSTFENRMRPIVLSLRGVKSDQSYASFNNTSRASHGFSNEVK